MKSSYANVKDFILKNGTPIQTEESGSQFKDKAIPVPDDQKQKETFGRITKVERNLEQIRETIKEQTVKIGETTLETERYRLGAIQNNLFFFFKFFLKFNTG